ncbi:MAG: hypothetical protein Q6360_16220 [Candidatus Brocadiales bacterium]|nr:hypothetical protein [Candidatus Brocadiales bacterium]
MLVQNMHKMIGKTVTWRLDVASLAERKLACTNRTLRGCGQAVIHRDHFRPIFLHGCSHSIIFMLFVLSDDFPAACFAVGGQRPAGRAMSQDGVLPAAAERAVGSYW